MYLLEELRAHYADRETFNYGQGANEKCQLEWVLIGGTCHDVLDPFFPYDILLGKPIEAVNKARESLDLHPIPNHSLGTHISTRQWN